MESCRQEKDIINNQLVQKLEEIGLLNEKINTMQIALNRGYTRVNPFRNNTRSSLAIMLTQFQANLSITRDWKMFVYSKLKFRI